jgi:hypothetical protein
METKALLCNVIPTKPDNRRELLRPNYSEDKEENVA